MSLAAIRQFLWFACPAVLGIVGMGTNCLNDCAGEYSYPCALSKICAYHVYTHPSGCEVWKLCHPGSLFVDAGPNDPRPRAYSFTGTTPSTCRLVNMCNGETIHTCSSSVAVHTNLGPC